MTIEISVPGSEAEGSALPPPRWVGETNTLTVRHVPSAVTGQDMVAAASNAIVGGGRPDRLVIVAADSSALTLTF
jgi:hypothetical protein